MEAELHRQPRPEPNQPQRSSLPARRLLLRCERDGLFGESTGIGAPTLGLIILYLPSRFFGVGPAAIDLSDWWDK